MKTHFAIWLNNKLSPLCWNIKLSVLYVEHTQHNNNETLSLPLSRNTQELEQEIFEHLNIKFAINFNSISLLWILAFLTILDY